MSEPNIESWREELWRNGSLPRGTNTEIPEQAAEVERLLTNALEKLPDPPVPSNFNAQVMATIQLEAAAEHRQRSSAGWKRWFSSKWFPRTGIALAVAVVTLFSVQHQRSNSRAVLAQDVAMVSSAAALPKLEWLQDFEVITQLSSLPPGDTEMLRMLE